MKLFLTTTTLLFLALSVYAQPVPFKQNGLYGFKEGHELIIEPEYDYAFDFSDGLALVQKGDLWGFIDEFNTPVIPLKYDRCSEFTDGFALVVEQGKLGIINDAGHYVVPTECSHVEILRDGYCVGKNNGKHALFKDGNRLTEYAYDGIFSIYNGHFSCQNGTLYGVLDPSGNELIAPQFTSRPRCSSGRGEDSGYYFTGSQEGSRHSSYFSGSGELVLDAREYDISQAYYPHIYKGEKDGKITVVNVISGEVLLPPTTASIVGEDWRPCDGYGYSSTSQLFYEMDDGLLMQSVAHPKNTATLEVLPIIFDEFLLALQSDGLYSVYSHDVELLAKDVHVKIERIDSHSPNLRICSVTERQLWMWKDGQFGRWNKVSNTLEFVSVYDQDEEFLFDAPGIISDQISTFEAIHHEGDNFIFTVISGGAKFIFLYKDSDYLWEMDMVDATKNVQFKKFQFDEYEEGGETFRDLYNVIMKVDGKKMHYGW